jgi:hypothetical protein
MYNHRCMGCMLFACGNPENSAPRRNSTRRRCAC